MLEPLDHSSLGDNRTDLKLASGPIIPRTGNYLDYLDPSISVEHRFDETFRDLQIDAKMLDSIEGVMAPLKAKHYATWLHSVRVALLCKQIAEVTGLEVRTLMVPGFVHDCGKQAMPLEILNKTEAWTTADRQIMHEHVLIGTNLVRSCGLYFCAEIIKLHHRFQRDPYPELKPGLHAGLSKETSELIWYYARMLALADCFDALHRVNQRNADQPAVTGQQIKEQMLEQNADQRDLILRLYALDIFTLRINAFPPCVEH